MMGFSFEIFWAIGIVVLGVVIFFVATRQRRPPPAVRKEADKAARENWGKEEVH